MKRMLWYGPVLALALITACSNPVDVKQQSAAIDAGSRAVVDSFGNTYLLPWSPYNYEVLESRFVAADSNGNSQVIGADRKLNDAVWAGVPEGSIDNYKHPTSASSLNSGTNGTLRSVWDGYTLYLAVQVNDRSPSNLAALTSSAARMTSPGNNNWANFDAVEFDIDIWNHKIDKWILDGMVKVSRNGKLAGNRLNGTGDETWADPYSQPEAREFTDRLKDWNSYEITNGYITWLAIEIYDGKLPQNGDNFGIDVMIQDSPSNNTARTGRTYWSHDDNSYRFNSMDGNLDWGAIVLTGGPAVEASALAHASYAKSDWMLTNPIRWAKGDGWWPANNASYLINLPDTVADAWTTESWDNFQTMIAAGKAMLTAPDNWGRNHVDWSVYDQQAVTLAANNIEAAIVQLQRADDVLGATKFDAPVFNTLTDPMVFKTDGNFGEGRIIPGITKGKTVSSWEEWQLRIREIKALAAIYEYGPIPEGPSEINVVIQSTPPIPAHWERPGWWIVGGIPSQVPERPASYSMTASFSYNGTEYATWDGTPDTRIIDESVRAKPVQNVAQGFNISFPSPAQKQANGIGVNDPVPLVVSFSGNTPAYLNKGIATLQVGTSSTTDARGNTVWYNRTGTMRQFYPYVRGARYEISNEMGASWGASRAIDVLYKAAEMDLVTRDIQITNISSSADFELGDELSADGTTWWTVGELAVAQNPTAQLGPGAIRMLYLADGAIPPTTSGAVTFTQFRRFIENGVYGPATRGNASAAITVGGEVPTGRKIKDYVDYTKLVTDGFSINAKYAFVSAVFDDRVNLTIPGAGGATGPQPWRYDSMGNDYAFGRNGTTNNPGGAELLADNTLHNPGRANETLRRFLTHFKWYVRNRGLDANGNFSHGYGERLPFDNHELVAALYPRAIIERNTFNDYNDGSETDAISLQGAMLVYKYIIDKGWGGTPKTPAGVTAKAEDLIKFNYRATGGHGADSTQPEREAAYMSWYFYGKSIPKAYASHLNTDPFLNDRLVTGGSNSYERHYGGFKVMMPWSWAAPYYPK